MYTVSKIKRFRKILKINEGNKYSITLYMEQIIKVNPMILINTKLPI